MFDLILAGARVIDGRGGPSRAADVGIRDGRIAAVGDLAAESARARRDLHGRALAPGFIDSHTHSDLSLLARPQAEAKARQGVTTEILGNCGFSPFPLDAASRAAFIDYAQPIFGNPDVAWDWADHEGYAMRLARGGLGVNAAMLVGHGAVRAAVMAFEDRTATAAEVARMQALVGEAMDAGAFGLSTGLAYVPGIYSDTDELVALARAAGARGGMYVTHLRDQVDRLVEAVEEALDVGRRAATPVLVSHHKTVGRRNFGKVERTLALLDRARAEGLATYSDTYPYIAGMSTMTSVLPPWMLAGGLARTLERLADPAARAQVARDIVSGLPGWENRIDAVGWDNIVIATVRTAGNQDLAGLGLEQAARLRGKTPLDLLCDLLLEEGGKVGRVTRSSCEADLERVLCHAHTMIGSDAIDADRPHPRQYGTFPRVLGEMARDRGLFPLETAVHRMTGLTAAAFGMHDVGLIEPGRRADLVVFDPARVRDTATYEAPASLPEGIEAVMVGGTWTVDEGRMTGALPGRLLRRGG